MQTTVKDNESYKSYFKDLWGHVVRLFKGVKLVLIAWFILWVKRENY